ncbi:MAG: response regulator [Lachnospiraceae bacterium]|nr:response regulator [Lachnospiraceae bacterium]
MERGIDTMSEQELDKSFLNKRVLLVEDNEINADVMVAMLEAKDIKVEVVYDGEEAVDKFESSPAGYYNAILMDIEMPVMTGVEASKVIRNLHKQDAMTIPIISVTANSMYENIFFSRKYGMDDYVAKPIQPDNLYSVLKKWFDKYAK